jgi:transposase
MPVWVWKEDMKGGARPGSGRKPTLIDERRALSLHKQGESMREIAERFNVSIYVIKYFFKKQRRLANDNRN